MGPNPFTPTFGIVPPHMAGRKVLLADMREAFESGLGDPNLATLLVGARGSGKTALLSCIAAEALAAGWISVNVIPSPNMLEDVVQRTAEAAAGFVANGPARHVSGISLGNMFGIEWTSTEAPVAPNWRTRMNVLLDALAERGVGLLITVDEVRADVDDVIQLAATYQLFIREGRKVALVMAGLPGNVSSLLVNENVSFLRRSRQRHLGRIADADIAAAFERTVADAGKAIEPEALELATTSAGGFPYMMQLVGHRSWQIASRDQVIAREHVERGVQLAREDLYEGSFASTYRELSAGDRRFLAAMLDDEGSSGLSDVARRMGKGTNYASTYKGRLFMQGIIDESPDGGFTFALPFFKDYLREKLAGCR